MSLTALMIEQIGSARPFVEDGAEVVPVWRINTPEGSYLVFPRFDHDRPEQRERVFLLISRFMSWKMATTIRTSPSSTNGSSLSSLAFAIAEATS
jgi:hypothetical protein